MELEIKDGPATVHEMRLAFVIANSRNDMVQAMDSIIELCESRVVGFDAKTFPFEDLTILGVRVMNKVCGDGGIPKAFLGE